MFDFNDSTIYSTSPIDLYTAMDKVLTPLGAWISWEPDTLLKHITSKTKLNSNSINKLLAVQAVAANLDLVCKDHTAFEAVGTCFCNEHYILGRSQPIGIEECMYTVKQIKGIAVLVHNTQEDLVMFYGEIPGYVASVAKLNSHRVLPIPLSFGQDILDYLYPNYGVDLVKEKDMAQKIDDADLKDLTSLDKTDNIFIHWLVGCYLYDPTIVVGVSN